MLILIKVLAKNAEIKKYRTFLLNYSKNLYKVEQNLHKFPYNHFDFDLDPVKLEVFLNNYIFFKHDIYVFVLFFKAVPYEQGSLLQLIRTDNKVLNKIVTVFAALSSEIDFLVREGENKYSWGLLLFGEGKNANLKRLFPFYIDKLFGCCLGPEPSKESGKNLVEMGRFVSFLQVR